MWDCRSTMPSAMQTPRSHGTVQSVNAATGTTHTLCGLVVAGTPRPVCACRGDFAAADGEGCSGGCVRAWVCLHSGVGASQITFVLFSFLRPRMPAVRCLGVISGAGEVQQKHWWFHDRVWRCCRGMELQATDSCFYKYLRGRADRSCSCCEGGDVLGEAADRSAWRDSPRAAVCV